MSSQVQNCYHPDVERGSGVCGGRCTTDLLRILEEVLPARFGGASTDYQLVEESREGGLSRLTLTVSPHVGAVDEDLVRRTFLDELGRDGSSGRLMAGAWDRAEAVTVKRLDPLATKAGKILPFHLIADAPTSRSRSSSGAGP